MTDAKLANDESEEQRGDAASEREAGSRSRQVKPGHLEVGEFTSGHIGASAPFGKSNFPLPAKHLYYEHPPVVGPRILDDERE